MRECDIIVYMQSHVIHVNTYTQRLCQYVINNQSYMIQNSSHVIDTGFSLDTHS